MTVTSRGHEQDRPALQRLLREFFEYIGDFLVYWLHIAIARDHMDEVRLRARYHVLHGHIRDLPRWPMIVLIPGGDIVEWLPDGEVRTKYRRSAAGFLRQEQKQ